MVAATKRNLEAGGRAAAKFREDLYYRLAVVRLTLPPLRDRREDVPLLVEHIVRQELAGDPTRADAVLASVSGENLARLAEHPWPGNVRELRNLILRTLALSAGQAAVHLEPPTIPGATPAARSGEGGVEADVDLDRPFSELKQAVVARFERSYLQRQLERFDGNFSRAAAASGLDRMYFKRLLKKHR